MMRSAKMAPALILALAVSSACGVEAAPQSATQSTAATLPADAEFSLSLVDSIIPPDESLQFSSQAQTETSILSGMFIFDCDQLGSWLGASIPKVSGYAAICGVISPTGGLPERHGRTMPESSELLEYTVQVEYAPEGVDLADISAPEAFNRGLIDVALRYNANSWNGNGFPATSTKSNPLDARSGGYVYGKIDSRVAIVQMNDENDTRLQTTEVIGGDTFMLVLNAKMSPADLIRISSKLDLTPK